MKLKQIIIVLFVVWLMGCSAQATKALPATSSVKPGPTLELPTATSTATPEPAVASTATPESTATPSPEKEGPVLTDEITLVKYEEPVTLKIGQSALFEDKLSITFVAVTQDSRCPPDVTCVWEGEVVAQLHLQQGETDLGMFEISSVRNRVLETGGYTIEFMAVSPPPAKSGQSIAASAYEITLVVNK